MRGVINDFFVFPEHLENVVFDASPLIYLCINYNTNYLLPTDKSHCVREQAELLKFAQCDLSNSEIHAYNY